MQQKWREEFSTDYPMDKLMYATWILPGRTSRKEAHMIAQNNRPHRISLLKLMGSWYKFDFILPDDEEIRIDPK